MQMFSLTSLGHDHTVPSSQANNGGIQCLCIGLGLEIPRPDS